MVGMLRGEMDIFTKLHFPPDPMPHVAAMLKVIRSVYGDRKQLEKSLKNAAGTNQDRVSNCMGIVRRAGVGRVPPIGHTLS